MQRYPFYWLLACCLLQNNVISANTNPYDGGQRRNEVLPSESFRPQPHVVKVENYRYVEIGKNTSEDGSGGVFEEVLEEVHQLTNYSDTQESGPQSLLTTASDSSPLEKLQQRTRNMSVLFDEVDKMIFSTALPLSAVFAIIPIASALDLFWVNRLGDALAVAGQAAANQVYNSAFWLFAFLPTITATLVSKSHASGELEKTQESVCQALLFAMIIALPGAVLMFFRPSHALSSILKDGSPAFETARPYLKLRAFSFVPMMISFVGFSTFRGTMEIASAVKITMTTSILAAVLDPLLIHVFGFGVRGAALAGLGAEYTSAAIYLKLLIERNLLRLDKLTKLPSWSSIAPLIKGSVALQIRSFALNLTQLMVTRVIQSIDDQGVAPAAHALALQTFQLGMILLGALGMAAQTLVPTTMAKQSERSGLSQVNIDVNTMIGRLLRWGVSLGTLVSLVQLVLLPNILSSSPLTEVRHAAKVPAMISLSLHAFNAVVSIGEGTMMGSGSFAWMSVNIIAASLAYLATLQVLPQKFGLTGVWLCMATFTVVRLTGSVAFFVTKMRTPPAATEASLKAL